MAVAAGGGSISVATPAPPPAGSTGLLLMPTMASVYEVGGVFGWGAHHGCCVCVCVCLCVRACVWCMPVCEHCVCVWVRVSARDTHGVFGVGW